MISLIEIPVLNATILAIAMPVIFVCLFLLLIPLLRNVSGNRVRRYLSYLVKPPRIGSINTGFSESDAGKKDSTLWREIKVRLFFVYLAIALFLITFMISEFYEVMFDLLLPVTQGSTGDARTVTSVVIQSPFSVGWTGTMPWYGGLPAPSPFGTYHETWSWIFFTAAFTDNPYFLENVVIALLLISVAVGLVFLVPLASKKLRQSFLSSVFFFMAGMAIFTKGAFGCFAYAWALLSGYTLAQYGILSVTGDMIPNLIDAISYGIPIIIAMFAIFLALGNKLWKIHYDDFESRRWFLVFITISYWIGLALTILVV